MPNLPPMVLSPEECRKIEQSPTIISKEAAEKLIINALAKGLVFHNKLWTDDMKQRAKNIRYMKKHPEEFGARERSAKMFVTLFAPREKKVEPPDPDERRDPRDVTPGNKMTVDKLRSLNLSEEQLKNIAGIEEEK